MFNAGVQKTVLLIPQAEQWQLQTMTEMTDNGIVEISKLSQPLTTESPVPTRVIQYVKNTLEPLLIDEGKTEIPGILEGYLLKYNPQSVLCLPLLNQGQLVAIVYLEHPTTKGVFTPNRLAIIRFLCAQAAVSLQNAQLYDQAQQAIQELHQTQQQLAQSEKMSNLRNLVAGVTNEINQPVGFLQGNIQPALDYVQDLLDLINLYQSEYPQPNDTIKAKTEAIDLEFIREDFPRLLESMHQGINRIRNISNSLVQHGEKNPPV
ncbi:MAG: GAF domain-containing protein [Symploca sp. SIO3E6]|nr:GAF domain-containing protein [Caldora sp. SIO3E6]